MPGEIEHRVDHVHAAAGHAAGRAFLAALAPVVAAEAVGAGSAEIAFDVQQLAEAAVVEHAADFLQRRLKAPVVADGERHLAVGAGAHRGLRAPRGQGERLFGEDVLAGLGGGDDLRGMRVCGVASTMASIFGIGEHFLVMS